MIKNKRHQLVESDEEKEKKKYNFQENPYSKQKTKLKKKPKKKKSRSAKNPFAMKNKPKKKKQKTKSKKKPKKKKKSHKPTYSFQEQQKEIEKLDESQLDHNTLLALRLHQEEVRIHQEQQNKRNDKEKEEKNKISKGQTNENEQKTTGQNEKGNEIEKEKTKEIEIEIGTDKEKENEKQNFFQCGICGLQKKQNLMYPLDKCFHYYCISCLSGYILDGIKKQKVSNLSCKTCQSPLVNYDFKYLLTNEQYEEYERASLSEAMEGTELVKCPNCNFQFERISSTKVQTDYLSMTEFDIFGQPLSIQAKMHRNENRYRCTSCHKNFCANCNETPYHLGYNCEDWIKRKNSLKCRFCETTLTESNLLKGSEEFEVCNSSGCVELFKNACNKKLPCGHFCCGIKDEEVHLGCLQEKCQNKILDVKKNDKQTDQRSDDFCNICWITSLETAPCIRLQCGHIFHYHCLMMRLKTKWNGARITFNFIKCPLCKSKIEHVSLTEILKPINELWGSLQIKIKKRLEYEGLINDKRIKKDYNNDIYEFGMQKLAYYPCFKCKKPYFGGLKDCGNQREYNENFDESELICGGCSFVEGSNSDPCKKHGTDYLIWKCKFCCNIAVWFCWGNTHFCDSCHRKASTLPNLPKDQLPKCLGPPNCRGKHPPNGVEHCYGCGLCEDSNDKVLDF
ncbi:e3 ubiquitin-protein ligase mycbp2 [Anaeramoeba flamelloides]|uniref:RCR-type E3 ubiquitin transferase n=1 Tax=Anaeramoeba flamelloides TaxID=1746091 RepID=A0AAV7YQN5_9EUKA|nr:e3 ubiquitin-protein ligase mycbp2 [Anaeramoeba flamelloides]